MLGRYTAPFSRSDGCESGLNAYYSHRYRSVAGGDAGKRNKAMASFTKYSSIIAAIICVITVPNVNVENALEEVDSAAKVAAVKNNESRTGKQDTTAEYADARAETAEAKSDWETQFALAGFTKDEIADCKEILKNVGITDYHDVDIIENGNMHIVRGEVFSAENWQLNVTLENRKIIYVCLAGIPDEKTEAYINWLGNLKFRKVGTTRSVDLYSDTQGGYLAKLDWDNKVIGAYDDEE